MPTMAIGSRSFSSRLRSRRCACLRSAVTFFRYPRSFSSFCAIVGSPAGPWMGAGSGAELPVDQVEHLVGRGRVEVRVGRVAALAGRLVADLPEQRPQPADQL